MRKFLAIFAFLSVFLTHSQAQDETILNSANAFSLVMQGKNVGEIVQNSKAILIFPSVKKLGFIVGGMFGEGVMVQNGVVYKAEISNASLGLQIGYEDNYLVIFVMSDAILNKIRNSSITLGADATVLAGNYTANTGTLNALTQDVYVFTNKSGIFVGASLGGVVLEMDGSKIYSQNSYGYTNLIEAIERAK